MLDLDERQQEILMKLKQSIKEASQKLDLNNKHIDDNKIANEDKINKLCGRYVHSNDNKNVAMNKINNSKNLIIKRGEMWMVDLGNNGNSIQSGIHPYLVTSNDLNNQYSRNITGCSGTSKIKSKLPVHVDIEEGCGGVKVKTTILCETLCPIDKSKFLYKMGEVDDLVMQKVERAIRIQNGELKEKTPLERLTDPTRLYIVNKIRYIEKAKESIDFYKSINADTYSINLAEDERIKEENALKYYCYQNKIEYDVVYNNYYELIGGKDNMIAI
jgi:mRNA interferase MazF